MKKNMFAFSLLLLLVLLVACGGEDEANGNSDSSTSEDGIVLRVMDWSDSTRAYKEQMHEKFLEEHPEVSDIEYTTLTQDQFRDTILSAVRSGEAPDIFPPPLGYKLGPLVEDGWFQPLSGLVEDDFFDIFHDGIFVEGVNQIDGEIYNVPEQLPQPTAMVFYNKELFEKAGLDPENPPETYEEFREYAQKITEAGNGEFYGLIESGKQVNRWDFIISEWSGLNGSGLSFGNPVSMSTGEAPYHTEAVTDIFELFDGISKDGSLHPQSSSITAPEARQLFANGEAGFIVQGSWNIGMWSANNPDLDYGVMAPPTSDGERKGSVNMSLAGYLAISADTEHPELAAEYLKEYYAGDIFQPESVKNQLILSTVEGVNEEYATGKFLEFYDLTKEIGVIGPIAESENPDVTAVYSEYVDVTPSAAEVLQGVAISGLTDYEPMLEGVSEQTDATLANAIEAAKGKGADVSIEDFKYPDWDLMSNYK